MRRVERHVFHNSIGHHDGLEPPVWYTMLHLIEWEEPVSQEKHICIAQKPDICTPSPNSGQDGASCLSGPRVSNEKAGSRSGKLLLSCSKALVCMGCADAATTGCKYRPYTTLSKPGVALFRHSLHSPRLRTEQTSSATRRINATSSQAVLRSFASCGFIEVAG